MKVIWDQLIEAAKLIPIFNQNITYQPSMKKRFFLVFFYCFLRLLIYEAIAAIFWRSASYVLVLLSHWGIKFVCGAVLVLETEAGHNATFHGNDSASLHHLYLLRSAARSPFHKERAQTIRMVPHMDTVRILCPLRLVLTVQYYSNGNVRFRGQI